MNHKRLALGLVTVALFLSLVIFKPADSIRAQGEGTNGEAADLAYVPTAFTYQGRLTDGGVPADGLYDFRFELYDSVEGIDPPLVTLIIEDLPVTQGFFTEKLYFGEGVFDGNGRWLGIGVRPWDETGAFTPLAGRQEITLAPYAIYAQTAPWGGLVGVPAGFADGIDNNTTYSPGFGLNLVSGQFSVDISEVQQRVYGSCGDGWSIRTIYADGTVSCEIDDDTTYTSGFGLYLASGEFSVNPGEVQKRVDGACADGWAIRTIYGDGMVACQRVDDPDLVWRLGGNAGTSPGTDYLGTSDNQALELGVNGTRALRIEPDPESPNLIGGHSGNYASAGVYGAFIGAGGDSQNPNYVTDHYGTVAGGVHNRAGDNAGTLEDAIYATVGGGVGNRAFAGAATISGGSSNYITGNAGFIGGGYANSVYGVQGTVCGGNNNIAGDSFASVGGGHINYAYSIYSTVAGGEFNYVKAGASHGTIGGGYSNEVSETGEAATVSGGYDNTASGDYATIGGGQTNSAGGTDATIGGGKQNSAHNTQATVAGGASNQAGYRATVGGGLQNMADSYGAVPGGFQNYATGFSFAAGRRAKADHEGSFVFADSNDFNFATLVEDSFKVRTTGGVRFVVGIDGSGNTTWSCALTYGNNWSCTSDRNMKENLITVEGEQVLERLSQVPIQRWNAIGGDPEVDHMGPMAQDFYAAFGLGEDERLIGSMDANGVALAAIQGLFTISQEQELRINDLQAENSALKQQLVGGGSVGSTHPLWMMVYFLTAGIFLLACVLVWVLFRLRSLNLNNLKSLYE